MSSIHATLANGLSGLLAHQSASHITSNNITNVNTEGYSRQEAILSNRASQYSLLAGMGVEVSDILRINDSFTTSRYIEQSGYTGYDTMRADLLAPLDQAFAIDETGIQASINQFFSALDDVATDPSSTSARQVLLSAGEQLATSFNEISRQLTAAQTDANAILQPMAEQVNSLTKQIADLNGKIQTAQATGQNASELQDTRDQLVREVVTLTGANTFQSSSGLGVQLSNGYVLVEGIEASVLSVEENAATGFYDIVGTFNGSNRTTLSNVNGKIGAAIDVRDNELQQALDTVDSMAFDLATAFNAIHTTGVGLDGGTGRDFFTAPGAVSGAAANMSLDAAIVNNPEFIAAAQDLASLPGDNRIALQLADLSNVNSFNGGTMTLQEYMSDTISWAGSVVSASNSVAEWSTGLEEQLAEEVSSISGVSLEEEMVKLMSSQRALEASARVIQAADEMFDTILSLKS